MPSRLAQCGLLLLATLPPFLARALGSGPLSFGMFAEVERYHLEIRAELAAGSRRLRLAELTPHLSRDAARVVLPAEGYGFGHEQVQELRAALPDLALLVCQLEPTASSVTLHLFHAPVSASDLKRGGSIPALGMARDGVTESCRAR